MKFLIFLNGESRTPFIDVSGHSGRQHRFLYDEKNKCMALDGNPSDADRFAEVAEDLIGVRGCFKVHLKCIKAAAAETADEQGETKQPDEDGEGDEQGETKQPDTGGDETLFDP